jgi:hypothetical protein
MEIRKMPDLRIGKAIIPVEGIKQLKDVKSLEDPNIKAQLMKDGLDEIVFQKGDQVFIAYKQNLDLSRLKLNLENFDENSAYDAGQLSENGEAVKVLFADDETKESFWAAPYMAVGRGIKDLINSPEGKSGIIAFAAGAATGVVGKVVPGAATRVEEKMLPAMSTTMKSVVIGSLLGSTAAGLKAESENNNLAGATILINGLSYAGGIGAGIGGVELAKLCGTNPRAAAITIGTTAAIVGTGIALDLLSDNSKTVTYKVINKIAN